MEPHWAEVELRGTKLRDPRRVKTLARTVTALCHRPQLPLTAALGRGAREAAGDLFKHEDTRVADLIAGSVVSTARRHGHARVNPRRAVRPAARAAER